MPKIVDWDARRDEILSATWRVIARDGIAGATIRAIAREANCSRGILAHYFDDKAGILGSALVMSHRRVVARMEAQAAGLAGLDALRVIMLEALPLDDQRDLEAQIEISFWGRALGNPALRRLQHAEFDRFAERLRALLAEAGARGELRDGVDLALAAHQLLVLIDGLSAERVLYPDRVTPERQQLMLDELLDSVRARSDSRVRLRGCSSRRTLMTSEGRLTVALPYDSAAKFQEYAHPEMIVSTEWVAAHLDDPGLVVAESDEDVLLYETGHVPGAVKLDWHTELNDPVTRDYVDGAGFARLMSAKGIGRDTTLVLYGDKNNWWAAYALWVCSLFGHPDVRLMDGGRAKWIAEGRPLSTEVPSRPQAEYPVIERDDKQIRAFQDQVLAHLGQPLVDVRSPGEYTGELLHMPDYPQEGALRGGHIPGAKSIPWARAAAEDATFRTRAELEGIYRDGAGLGPDDDIVVYCRIGERSSHTWFVLHHLLGYPHVRNYDGSWTEWGNSVRVPITRGDSP